MTMIILSVLKVSCAGKLCEVGAAELWEDDRREVWFAAVPLTPRERRMYPLHSTPLSLLSEGLALAPAQPDEVIPI
jgi:hypothetical protein